VKRLILTIAAVLTLATSAFAQLGSLSADLVFTPITPCRILDTRLMAGGAGTPIPAGGISSYYAGGVSNFVASGGSATNCGLQTAGLNIAAVAINFVAVSPSAAGYITVFPFGGVQPTASTLNYTAGEVVANSAIVKVSQVSSTAMSIYSLATTHVVADVTGYYSKPISNGSLECMDTSLVSVPINSGPVNSLYFNFLAAPACPVGYTQVSLRCMVSDSTSSASESITGHCNGTSSAIGANLYASKTCCRIPGR
jgi:hypothetical protein